MTTPRRRGRPLTALTTGDISRACELKLQGNSVKWIADTLGKKTETVRYHLHKSEGHVRKAKEQ